MGFSGLSPSPGSCWVQILKTLLQPSFWYMVQAGPVSASVSTWVPTSAKLREEHLNLTELPLTSTRGGSNPTMQPLCVEAKAWVSATDGSCSWMELGSRKGAPVASRGKCLCQLTPGMSFIYLICQLILQDYFVKKGIGARKNNNSNNNNALLGLVFLTDELWAFPWLGFLLAAKFILSEREISGWT